jgi:Leucine-rich repeat (LRR) protein
MNYKKLTVQELKSICKKNHIKGYSYLNKEDLIKIIKKNLKKQMMKGGDGNKVPVKRIEEIIGKRINGDDIILDRKTLSQLLGYSSEHIFYSDNDFKLYSENIIDLSYCNIIEIKKDAFPILNATILKLDNNKITKIEDGAFNNLINLKELYLNNNNITKIEVGIFNEFSNLEKLDLSNNHITKIDPKSLSNLSYLEELNLSTNQITTLTKNEFYGLNSLKNLDLSNNKITEINSLAFHKSHKLLYLNLLNNNELKKNFLGNLNKDFKHYQRFMKNNNKLIIISNFNKKL